MSWFDDIQGGIYNIVGMLDPSDPGYQGYMKAQYMNNEAKLAKAKLDNEQGKNILANLELSGIVPKGYKYTPESAVGKWLANMQSGGSPDQRAQSNALGLLLSGKSPADVMTGSLTPQQIQRAAPIAANIEMSPYQQEQMTQGRMGLDRLDRQLKQTDEHFGIQQDFNVRQLLEHIRQFEENKKLGWANYGLGASKLNAELGGAGKLSLDELAKAQEDFRKAITAIQNVTGNEKNPMSINDALTYTRNNSLSWIAPAYKLIKSGQMSMDDLINHLVFANYGPNADPNKVTEMKSMISSMFGGQNPK